VYAYRRFASALEFLKSLRFMPPKERKAFAFHL